MKNKKSSLFFFGITVIIVGKGLFNQFDFENSNFEKPGLATVYIITLICSTYFLIQSFRKSIEK